MGVVAVRHVVRVLARVRDGRVHVAYHRRRYHEGPFVRGVGRSSVQRLYWDAGDTAGEAAGAVTAAVLGALAAGPRAVLWIVLEPPAVALARHLIATGDLTVLPAAVRAAAGEVLPGLGRAVLVPADGDERGAVRFAALREALEHPEAFTADTELRIVTAAVRRSVLDRAEECPVSAVDRPGWVSDFSLAHEPGWGVAALVRADAAGRPLGTAVTCRVPALNATVGEVLGVLLAHVFARWEGEAAPVLYTDYRAAARSLRHFRRPQDSRYLQLRPLLDHVTGRELDAMDIRWIERASCTAHVMADTLARCRIRDAPPRSDDVLVIGLDDVVRALRRRTPIHRTAAGPAAGAGSPAARPPQGSGSAPRTAHALAPQGPRRRELPPADRVG